jgi:4'-phosphopantetheinyl transferase
MAYIDQIAVGDVHIWQVEMSLFEPMIRQLEEVLAADERHRADRFFFPNDRTIFITARGLLRFILAEYLDVSPRQVRFVYGPQGKPGIEVNSSRLFFNISHSGGRALVAVAKGSDVGIDIEKIDAQLACGSVTEAFSCAERLALAAIGDSKRLEAFFKCWTSKEAYIKGIGLGLTAALDDFDVCVDPDKPARLLRPLKGNGGVWFLHRLDESGPYVASVATMSQDARLFFFDCRQADMINAMTGSSDGHISGTKRFRRLDIEFGCRHGRPHAPGFGTLPRIVDAEGDSWW